MSSLSILVVQFIHLGCNHMNVFLVTNVPPTSYFTVATLSSVDQVFDGLCLTAVYGNVSCFPIDCMYIIIEEVSVFYK